jgi:hypothetical protein
VETGPDTGDHGPIVNGDRNAPTSRAKRRLQAVKHFGVTVEPTQLPLPLESSAQTREVARRRREIRLLDLDVMETNDRVDVDGMGVCLLAYDLPVQLALGWHVDHELADDAGRAAEATAGG